MVKQKRILVLFGIVLLITLSIASPKTYAGLSESDETLLEEIEKASFFFFWNTADPASGLVRDRLQAKVCSVASLGFGLAAVPIGVERGYVTHESAETRVKQILKTLESSNAHHEGMFCHFIDLHTGNVSTGGYESGASSVDTALLMAGVLTAGEYFGGEIKEQAEQLYARVNWKSFVDPSNGQVYMIWFPDSPTKMDGPGKFDKQTWNWYTDETLLVVMLGIAAPKEEFRLDKSAMTNWIRKTGKQGDHEFVLSWTGALFTYMFAQCYYNFSELGADPGGTDWFFNTAMAVRSNRDWCREHAGEFRTYGQDRWGITSGSGPNDTYVVPGPQPKGAEGDSPEGGTLHPYGAGMSVPFDPRDSLNALHHMKNLKVGGKPLWTELDKGGYGFWDGFNIDQNWVSDDIIGIGDGPMLLMIENARTGLIWNLFHEKPVYKNRN